MRVVAGEFRSRKLIEVDDKKTRETRDRIKESIFNSVQSELYESKVLDLFSGSGSLGIEALSRGASHCTFVDVGMAQVKTVKQNVVALDIVKRSSIVKRDYRSFLQLNQDVFDVIILDPPYDLHVIEDIVQIIQEKKILSENGIIICLYFKNVTLDLENFDIISYKSKNMGITNVSFLKWGN